MNWHLVLSDPKGEYWDGAVVPDETAVVIEAREGATIPVCPDLFTKNPVAGAYKRSWGGGWPLRTAASRVAPAILYAVPSYTRLHWRIRIRRVAAAPETGDGFVRLVPDGNLMGCTGHGVAATDAMAKKFSELGDPDAQGGWTLSGGSTLSIGADQYLGLSVYGRGEGYAVEWVALSQTDR